MKNIDILKKGAVQYSKDICLGNGARLSFNSKRTARYFISDTNRFLTKCLVVINSCYADTFYQYRSMWLITSNSKYGASSHSSSRERKINGMLSSTGDMLDKFNFTMYGSNDPFFSFIDLQKAALFCKSAAEELHEYLKQRNFTNSAYECQMLADRCQSVYNNLRAYGHEKTPAATAGANPTTHEKKEGQGS